MNVTVRPYLAVRQHSEDEMRVDSIEVASGKTELTWGVLERRMAGEAAI